MKTYTITKANFINWMYNSGYDDDQEQMARSLGYSIIEQLIDKGTTTITAEEVFDNCEQTVIPCNLLEEYDENSEDFAEAEEVGELNHEYELKLI